MLTMIHPEMIFVAQPIVASPRIPLCSSFLEASGTISDTFPWRSRIPKTIVLPLDAYERPIFAKS